MTLSPLYTVSEVIDGIVCIWWLRLQALVEGIDSRNPFAVGLLADLRFVIMFIRYLPVGCKAALCRELEGTTEAYEAAKAFFHVLIEADNIRAKYWTRRMHEIDSRLEIS